ncbi:hypothetical protein [Streptomyces sp. NPDC002785]|uniref:hypothetical protein n=1 Tax=Streptomyces sp. NPDC002785 TaxID=3154543 RepID=UPI0033231C22
MITQRKGAWGSEGCDVDELLDELYVTPPPDFVSRREELAAARVTSAQCGMTKTPKLRTSATVPVKISPRRMEHAREFASC